MLRQSIFAPEWEEQTLATRYLYPESREEGEPVLLCQETRVIIKEDYDEMREGNNSSALSSSRRREDPRIILFDGRFQSL